MTLSYSKKNRWNEVKRIPVKDIREPLFNGDDRVLCLDVDGVLVGQVQTYFNNVRGADVYKVNKGAKGLIGRGKKKFNEWYCGALYRTICSLWEKDYFQMWNTTYSD